MENSITPLKLTIPPPPQAQARPRDAFWDGDSPSFEDMLDLVNPLQHIPIVSSIYQSMTGDTQSAGAKLAGGLLFGGPLGLLGAIFGSILEAETGADLGGHLVAAVTGENPPASKANQLAQNTASPEMRYMPASQHSAYNAYVSVQNLA